MTPIKPENRARYPKDWESIAWARKVRAGWRCQGSPAYPDCRAEHGVLHPETGSVVALTVGHLDHVPEHVEPANLRVWCQKCHNTYDAQHRRGTRARTKHDQAETRELFEE